MSDRLVDRSERVFQIWGYTVGMRRLLLRSTKNETFSTRIDVLFQNVKALLLPTSLEGLVVGPASDSLSERIIADTGLLPDEGTRFYRVETHSGCGYVVAGVVVEDEDSGEYFEPSRYWPGPDGNPG